MLKKGQVLGCTFFIVLSLFCLFHDARAADCTQTSVGFTPLIDMTASQTYQGFSGMLYMGSNEPPAAHLANALSEVANIVPRDANGNPSAQGKIGFISIGMSNTNQEFGTFMTQANNDPLKSSQVVLVNGAQGGKPAESMVSLTDSFWTTNIPSKLSAANITAQQVQVVWFKQTNASPTGPFPNWALNLKSQFVDIMQNIRTTFPNARIAYMASRIYAGYATSTLNPEPYAYEQAFACKWLIDDQIDGVSSLNWNPANGVVRSPLLLWGTYIWADGINQNGYGMDWICPTDYQTDGTHPSTSGRTKVANRLTHLVHNDATTTWYRGDGGEVDPCTQYTTKQACLADCRCGGCSSPRGCMRGTAAGPCSGTCSGTWSYKSTCTEVPC